MPLIYLQDSTEPTPLNSPWRSQTWSATLAALALLTLLIHGYHPFAEDGGLYVAGVQYTLDPALFPHYTAFVTEHLRFSIFAPTLACIAYFTHISLESVLFVTDFFSIFLTLFAGRQLLRRCVTSQAAQLAGVALLAAWWTIPVAGTSLLLMDPYVTARSFSTPLSLLAIAFALDQWSWNGSALRSVFMCTFCLIVAALFHPLMAAYAFAMVVAVRTARLAQPYLAWACISLLALALAATLQAKAPAESAATVAAAISRYYWFLSQWQWFELAGLTGPILLLTTSLYWQTSGINPATRALIRASIFTGCLATVISIFSAQEHYATHLVARLQPLRIFLPVYAIMTLLLGARLMQYVLGFRCFATNKAVQIVVPLFAILSFSGIMFFVQLRTFPASPHVELPGRETRNQNPWVQAFLWVRRNTPPDALFALDAKYINEDGEDAQTFRAWSLRSALPDFSKDGGEASITPALADTWQQAASAQKGLSDQSDATRDASVRLLGATWMVLHSSATTTRACPYDNGSIKVCKLQP